MAENIKKSPLRAVMMSNINTLKLGKYTQENCHLFRLQKMPKYLSRLSKL